MLKAAAATMISLIVSCQPAHCDDDAIWTDRPVRVNPQKQNYERLPRLTLGIEGGRIIHFPLRLDMHDSTHFSADGQDYALSDLRPVSNDRLCRTEAGLRWPCGRNAWVFVSNLFRGRTVTCKLEIADDVNGLSECRTPKSKISYDIVAAGFAFPANDEQSDLQQALNEARIKRAGVWRDAGCNLTSHSC